MCIGITGAHGFIGRNLQILLRQTKIFKVITFKGNLNHSKDVYSFFDINNKIDVIIHLAGQFYGNFNSLLRNNLVCTHHLITAMRKNKINKIIYISSGAVYGEPINNKSKETDELHPNTNYGLVKKYTEDYIIYSKLIYNIDYVILRLPNVYGNGNNKGVIFDFYKSITSNKKIVIYGNGKQSRQFLHVNDACKAIILSLNHIDSEIYNITTEKNISLTTLTKLFSSKFNFKIEFSPEKNKLKKLSLSAKKANLKLGFVPSIKSIEI